MLDLLMLNRTRTVNTTVTTDQYHSTPLAKPPCCYRYARCDRGTTGHHQRRAVGCRSSHTSKANPPPHAKMTEQGSCMLG